MLTLWLSLSKRSVMVHRLAASVRTHRRRCSQVSGEVLL
jgi:hypothetical protein